MPRSSTGRRGPSPTIRHRPSVWWGILPLLIPLLTGLLFAWHSLGDLDIWFHLRAGRDILDGHAISTVNRYSFSEPDHTWINHEWMFQVLATLTGPSASSVDSATDPPTAPDVTGWNTLRAFLTLLLLSVVLVGDRGWRRLLGQGGSAAAAWAGLPVLAGLMLLWPRLTIRPELFSYIFLVLVVRCVEMVLQDSDQGMPDDPDTDLAPPFRWPHLIDPRRAEGRLFLITVIWAQFHGFATLAPMIILLGALLVPIQVRLFRSFPGRAADSGSSGTRVPPPPVRIGAIIILAVLALALTPNGWNGLLLPVRALGQFSNSQVDLRTTISELVPLRKSPNSLGLTISLFQGSLIWGMVWIVATFGRVSLLRILIFALAALAAWTNQRNIGIYGVAFMLLHTGAGDHPWRLTLPRRWPGVPPGLMPALGLTITLLVAGLLWPQIIRDDFYLKEGVGRRFGSGLNPARYPTAAAEALVRQESRKYFANLDAAAFLLANTPGRIFIDGRTEAYSSDLWAEYLDIKRGDERALGLLAIKRRVDAVCLATGGGSFDRLALQLLNSPQWGLVTAEGAGLLFRPADTSSNSGDSTGGRHNKVILAQAAERTLAEAEHGSPARRADFCRAAGHLYMFAENDEQREAAYRRGLSYKTDHPTLNHNLGNLLMDKQRFQDAFSHFQAALEMNHRLVGSALNAGVCQMRLGKPGEATGFFQRAAAIDPDRFEAWVNLSVARLGSGNRPGAIRALKKALEIRPRDPRLLQRLRELEHGTGN